MAESENKQTVYTDVWERWGWIWSAIFYLSLAGSLLLALPDQDFFSSQMIVMLVLVVASALWYPVGAWYLPRHYPDFRDRPVIMGAYLLVAFGLWWGLVNIHGAFYFMLFSLFGQIFTFLNIRLAIPLAILVSAFTIYQQVSDDRFNLSPDEPALWIFIGSGLAFVLMAFWLNAIIGQSAERRVLIEQLEAAQEELAQAEREAGILAERQRLGQEIHDTLAQGFTSIVMHLEAADQALPPEATLAQHHLGEARRVARDSLAEARGLVWALRPVKLQSNTLSEAISRVVQQWSVSTGIHTGSTICGEVLSLHPQAEVALLRTVQEGLANIQKHASASEVNVTLSYLSDVVVLDIQDNGIGFDTEKIANIRPGVDGGYGLQSLQERITQLGGALTIESAVGEGTTLAVEIPA